MLEIRNIHKTYKTGSLVQKALDDVSLNLRDNEFVAILGPSGSGKTTLLNIIGGLDRYDDGDLIINHVSTKKYKDRDWDSYRNHTIGFVFQSYNLIPHQSVLSNVEMALTISGVSKRERKKRALEALEKVGLKGQEHKKPNQMSGGQMQRVAIARALVNNPDILLADEPTGALDTKTSVQIMDLLKEVAKDRLVVMVSHNPELAQEYATRVVRIRDGKIIDDSNPYFVDNDAHTAIHKNLGKAKMGFLTALSLSFNNLLSKKGRTILTAFAGSIGIIGIALILALSTGFQNYIDYIQEDTMSSYPLTVQSESANIFGALISSRVNESENVEDGKVKEQMMITSMMNSVGTNDLKSFKKWLEDNADKYEGDLTEIAYSYSISPRIYTKDVTNNIVQLNPNTIMSSFYNESAMSMMSSVSASSSMGTFSEYDLDKVKSKCELVEGRWPENYNELVLVLSQKDRIPDLMVYSLGLRDNSELKTLISQVMGGDEVTIKNEAKVFNYKDLMNVDLKLVDVSSLYKYNAKYDTYEDMSQDEEFMEKLYSSSETLTITGVAYNTEDNSSIAGIIYSHDLVQHVINNAKKSPIVQKQLLNKDIDVFSGNRFDEEKKKDELDFNDLITIDEDKLKDAFKINVSEDDFKFDTLSQDEMQKVIMDNAKDTAQSITNGPNLTQMVSAFSALNTMVLDNYTKTYETMPDIVQEISGTDSDGNTVSLGNKMKLDDVTLKEVSDSISASSYKNILDKVLKDNTDNKELSSMLYVAQILQDEDYNNLALSIKESFNNYYGKIKEISKDNFVVYQKTNQNIDGRDIEISLYINQDDLNVRYTSVELLASSILNDGAVAYTTKAANSIVNNYTTLMVAKSIGESVGSVVEPMMDGFENLADLFSEDIMSVDTDAFAKAFNFDLNEDEVSRLMQSMLTSSSATYRNNLYGLGYQDVDDPTSISFYFKDFESKEHFLKVINEYNNLVNDEEKQIKYTDITGMLISSVQTIVNAVTYVLIAFVSISLIVSSIMIAVITLISVMERTKEIGILRAMGASKHNVSSIFNAETFIIGLLSGTLGVTVSYLATFPINRIIHNLTDITEINAVLGIKPALILVAISVVLTMIAGFIPSKKAAKQDPVIALRSE